MTQEQVRKTYGDDVMFFTVENVSPSAFKVPGKFSHCTETERNAWIVPTRSGFLRFINDSRNLPRDKSTKIQLRWQLRDNTKVFWQISSPDSASALNGYWIIVVQALQKIDIKEELYTDYGSEHCFWTLQTQLAKATTILKIPFLDCEASYVLHSEDYIKRRKLYSLVVQFHFLSCPGYNAYPKIYRKRKSIRDKFPFWKLEFNFCSILNVHRDSKLHYKLYRIAQHISNFLQIGGA